MRVAMLNLTAGGLSGGYRKYLHRVVPMLRAEGTVKELLVALPPGHEQQPGIDGDVWSWRPGEHVRGYPALRDRVRAWKPDVVFIPAARYIDCHAPTLIMVQNMLPMLPATFRDGFRSWLKLRVDARLAKQSTSSATRIIAVSNYVQNYLVQQWAVPARSVGVVYHGVDVATPIHSPSSHASLPVGPFLFTAGSLYTYRGLEDAIRALSLTKTPVKLVIAGEGSAGYRAQMVALTQSLGVSNRVLWLGQVDATLMTVAYQQCVAFLMTSRVEACPNIALEAMASGARCISTSCAPMPEFFAQQALYYSADDFVALAGHIDTVINTPLENAAQYRLDVQQRAGTFTWEHTLRGVVRELNATLQDAS
ncbi:MAG: glycosyltransferase [Gemmatimonas sp.]